MTNPINKLKLVNYKQIAQVAVFILLISAIYSDVYASATVNQIYKLSNDLRIKSGKSALIIDEKLEKAAQLRIEDMFSKQYFDHFSSDGLSPWNAIKISGYEYKYAGENLAIGFSSDKKAFDAWVDSPTHYQNIIDQDYINIGVAEKTSYMNGEEKTLIVQLFASNNAQIKGVKNQENIWDKTIGWFKQIF